MHDAGESDLEALRAAVRASNLFDLEWSTILGAFAEEGIRTLEDLARRLSAVLQDAASFPQALDLTVLSRIRTDDRSGSLEHKIPAKPFLLDGVLYDPAEISRFNGQQLLFVVDAVFGDNILIVEDPDTISSLLSAQVFSALGEKRGLFTPTAESQGSVLTPLFVPPRGQPSEEPTTEPPAFDQYPYRENVSPALRLFSRSGWGGNRLDVGAGTQWADLTKAWIFFPFDDWNDEINSMLPTSSTHLFKDHINFGGSFLILPKRAYISNFGEYGWDARVSSVANYG